MHGGELINLQSKLSLITKTEFTTRTCRALKKSTVF